MNNVLFRRGDQTFIDENVPLNDGQIIFNETDEAIYLDNTIGGTVVRKRYGGGNLSRSDIDMALSTTSENPIANKVVTNAIGSLSSLQTNVKTNLVGAINEVNTKVSKTEVLYIKDIACSAITGNFVSKSDARITSNHVVTECVFSKPSAITTDVSWTTASGTLTLNGTCTDATCTVSVILALSNNNN